ncbi:MULTISPECIES: peptidase [unclassified Thioalkalivibrio]|uniref:peptidase n=1 Tax=unclassified Thioalkalivibrio TaxID=2621013 RepID=UPI000361DC28|nr:MULTISPECIES: peptidase [unclassified Thioalkalivibrio]
MQPFEIFRRGTHTSAGGTTLNFTEDDLRAAVEGYDPALHEAPITVGHPKDNLPAYGWIKGLEYAEDGSMRATPEQVDEAFAEMVQAGRFKKRSASFYTPDSPNNPTPGRYYLRHVGFLGAQPPAVKGLKDVAFSEEDEAVEFIETTMTAGLFRRLREWMIGFRGQEEADNVIPAYLVEDLEDAGRRELEGEADAEPEPGFTEAPKTTPEEDPMTKKTEGADGAKKDDQTTDFAEREAKLAEREQRIAEQEAAMRRQAAEAEFKEHAEAGRIRPQDVPALVQFAETLDAEAAVDFGEGEDATSQTPREFLSAFIAKLPKAIDYSERAADTDDDATEPKDNKAVADEARAYQANYKERTGRHLSFTEAVAAVNAGKHNAE